MSPDPIKTVDTSGMTHYGIEPIFKRDWWTDPVPWIWEQVGPQARKQLLDAFLEAGVALSKIRVEEANIRLKCHEKVAQIAKGSM